MLLDLMVLSDSTARRMAFLTLTLIIRIPALGARFTKINGMPPVSSLILLNSSSIDQYDFKDFIFKYKAFECEYDRERQESPDRETPLFWRFDEADDKFETVEKKKLIELLNSGHWRKIPDPKHCLCGGFFTLAKPKIKSHFKSASNSFAIRRPLVNASIIKNTSKDESATVKLSNGSLVPGTMYSKLSKIIRENSNHQSIRKEQPSQLDKYADKQ